MRNYIFGLLLLIQSVLQADEYCQAFQAFEADDFIVAREKLDPLAFKGDTKAQNLLGLVNLQQEKNSAAQKWLQNAAMKGEAKAAYNLGVYYYALGQNAQAERWMHKAEALTEAKLALGFLYTQKNMTKAKAYFYLAANEGNAFAVSHLCAIVLHERTSADEKYLSHCQGNGVEASYVTGKFYTSPKKYGSTEKAIYYLQYAADQGNVKAMNLLGEMLAKRNGPMDQDNAMQYFLKAADRGNVDAKVNAAWFYYTGLRWTRDPKKGFTMLERALKHNHPKAQLYMGILSLKGLSFSGDTVKQDVAKGWKYIKASAGQGDSEAMEYLIKNGVEVQKYQEQLRRYYREQEKAKALHFLHDGC